MSLEERWERMAADPLNADRIARFPVPVPRSLHPDALLLGYSVWADHGADSSVEATHMIRRWDDGHPRSATTLTTLGEPRHDPVHPQALRLLSEHDPEWRTDSHEPAGRERQLAALAERPTTAIALLIDDVPVEGAAFNIDEWMFWRSFQSGFVWSVAAPALVTDRGFTTRDRHLVH